MKSPLRSITSQDGSPGGKSLVAIAFMPAATALVLVVITALVILMTEQSDLAGIFATIADMWLGLHLVPVTISNVTVSVMPLLPTLVLIAGVARVCRRAATAEHSASYARLVIASAVLGPMVLTAIAIGVVNDATGTLTVATPPVVQAFAATAGVHLVGALLGLAPVWWPTVSQAWSLPSSVDLAAKIAVRAVAALLAAGAVLVLVRLLIRFSVVLDLVRGGNDAVGMTGLSVLSVAYLPNAVVGAGALTAGATAHVGDVSMNLWSSTQGDVLGVPIFAVLPSGRIPVYLLAAFVVPIAVGVWVGRSIGKARPELGPTVLSVLVTALLTGGAMATLSWAAGGELGHLGHVGMEVSQVGLYTTGIVGLVGLFSAIIIQQVGDTKETRKLLAPAPKAAPKAAAPKAAAPKVKAAAKAASKAEPVTTVVPDPEVAQTPVTQTPVTQTPVTQAPDTGPVDAPESGEFDAAEPYDGDVAELEELDSYTFADLPVKGGRGTD